MAETGAVRRYKVRLGRVGHGLEGRYVERRDPVWFGMARYGSAVRGKAKRELARTGWERRYMER